MFSFSSINAQIVALDYSSFSSGDCDVFANVTPFQGIFHQTNVGDVTRNSTEGAISLKFNYNNGTQKGTEFSIFDINFKKDYKYIVKIIAKNNSNYSEPAGLKCNFNSSSTDPGCNDVNFVNYNNSTFSLSNNWFQVVNGTSFIEYAFESDYLSSAQTRLGIGSFSLNNIGQSSEFIQTIYIKRIEIFEIAPQPTFTLSPSTVNIPCGSISPVIFTVTNVYNTPDVTYSWSYPGWTLVNSTATTRTLQPNLASTLPSNVVVTPSVSGVLQTSKSATVSRATFTSNAAISGANSLCTSANYTISGLQSGESVQWSISNTSVATLSNSTGTSVTVNKVSNGTVTLTATITNSCGQTTGIPKTINVGAPTFSGSSYISGLSSVGFNQNVTYSLVGGLPAGTTSTEWSIDAPINDNGGNPCNWELLSQNSTSATFKSGCIATTAVIRLKANNSCGYSLKYLYVTVSETIPCDPTFTINVFPNPSTDGMIYGDLVYPPNPCDASMSKESNYLGISVYDMFGNLVYNQEVLQSEFNISTEKFKKGNYILNISFPNGKTQREILIVK